MDPAAPGLEDSPSQRSNSLITAGVRGGIPLRGLALLSQLATAILFARWLGAQTTGLLASVLSITALVGLMFGLQLGAQAARAVDHRFSSEAWPWSWVLGALAALVGGGIAMVLWQRDPDQSLLLIAYLPVLFLTPATTLVGGTLAALGRAPAAVLYSTVSPTLRLLLVGALMTVRESPAAVGIAVVDTIVAVLVLAYGHRLVSRSIPLHRRPRVSFLREVTRSSPALLAGALSSLVLSKVDILMVSSLLGDTEAGIYYVAVRLAEMPLVLYVTAVSLFLPAVSHLPDGPMLRSAYRRSSYVMSWLLTPMLAVLAVFGDVIVSLLFGGEFEAGRSIYALTALGIYVQTVTGPSGQIMVSRRRHHGVAWISVGVVVGDIVLNGVLIPVIGLAGAALATAVAYLAGNLVALSTIWRHLGEHVRVIGYISWAVTLAVLNVSGLLGVRFLIGPTLSGVVVGILLTACIAILFAIRQPVLMSFWTRRRTSSDI